MDTLAEAIDALCEPERGFHFTSQSSPLRAISHQELRASVRSLARKLATLDNKPGDPVIIAIPDQAQFLQMFLAVIRARLVAVPVSPPAMIGDLISYSADIERIRKISGATRVLTTDALYQRLRSNHPAACLMPWSDIVSSNEIGELGMPNGSSPALIQFTSGSTGSPKGIELTHNNIICNALAIRESLGIDPLHDRGVSWLPFHHDMGLMGFLITPVLIQASIWYLPPLEFARRPRRWLELMHQTRATISYAPNFAYELAARSIKIDECKQWDLSNWRVAGCGGEPIIPDVLDRFAQQLKPAGFKKSAFVPSYGLAEATVAVSISPTHRGLITCNSNQLNDSCRNSTSSGHPVKDTDVRIVSSECALLKDGMEGEIQVRGPGVAKRIWSEAGPQPLTDQDGWLSTGDKGFLSQGELHVCGRIKETILINGCNYYAHDIEECAQTLAGIRRGGIVAIGRPGAGSEQLVLIAENRSAIAKESLQRNLRETIRKQLGLSVADVMIVSRSTIARTSSGKIKRHALKLRYLAGELAATPPLVELTPCSAKRCVVSVLTSTSCAR